MSRRPSRLSRLGWSLAVVAIGLVAPLPKGRSGEAWAAEDGVYGRLHGDLLLSIEVGACEAFPGESLGLRPAVLYLNMVGLYGQYHESFAAGGQPTARSVSGGIELRPLFLGRFARDLEQGPAWLDLFIDSWALDLGIYTAALKAPAGAAEPLHWDTGFEFGTGAELSLLPKINSPFIALRAALRWSLSYAPSWRDAHHDTSGYLMLSLGYHHLFAAFLVDPGTF